MDTIPAPVWIAAVAHHLHEHWHTLGPGDLLATARELQRKPELAQLEPADAVAEWLKPVETAS